MVKPLLSCSSPPLVTRKYLRTKRRRRLTLMVSSRGVPNWRLFLRRSDCWCSWIFCCCCWFLSAGSGMLSNSNWSSAGAGLISAGEFARRSSLLLPMASLLFEPWVRRIWARRSDRNVRMSILSKSLSKKFGTSFWTSRRRWWSFILVKSLI